MSDFLASRRLVINQQIQPYPPGPAIRAIQQTNMRLEQSRPRQEPVRAYQQPIAGHTHASR